MYRNILLNSVNFYSETENAGNSILPFISFVSDLAGWMMLFAGIVIIVCVNREWRFMTKDKDLKDKKKGYIRGGICAVIGVVLIILGEVLMRTLS